MAEHAASSAVMWTMALRCGMTTQVVKDGIDVESCMG